MKNLILILLTLSSLAAHSQVWSKINDIACAEDDLLGPGCVVYLTEIDSQNKNKIAIIFDYNDFLNYIQFEIGKEASDLIGTDVYLDTDYTNQVRDPKVIKILKSYNPSYFYLYGVSNSIEVTLQYLGR